MIARYHKEFVDAFLYGTWVKAYRKRGDYAKLIAWIEADRKDADIMARMTRMKCPPKARLVALKFEEQKKCSTETHSQPNRPSQSGSLCITSASRALGKTAVNITLRSADKRVKGNVV